MTIYYTLLIREDSFDPWSIEFGDYDLNTVRDEEEATIDVQTRIMTSGDRQCEINEELRKINEEYL